MKAIRWGRVFLLVCASLLGAIPAFAQTTGEIRGNVKDPSGAVIPNASVTATLVGTNTSRTVNSAGDGDYTLPQLAVGVYSVTGDAQGFKKFVAKDVVVSIGHVTVVNITLQIGAAAETITVEANAAQVETSSTQIGAVMTDTAIRELPLSTRNTYQLLQLQPGVQSQVGADLFYGSDSPGVVSVNGGRGRSNNYMVNGGDGNDIFVNGPAIQPSPDAVEEFRVITNSFDAEYGRNSGSVVNVVTKSGTNDFHGSVFEFFRNTVLNAKPFTTTTVSKPDFQQNQFGGTLGGPIKKDKTFFFGSYEGRRIKQGILSSAVPLPTASQLAGNFNDLGGSLTTGPTASALLGRCGAQLSPTAVTQMTQLANGTLPIDPATGTAHIPYTTVFNNGPIPTQCFDPISTAIYNQYVHPTSDGNFQASPNKIDNGDQATIKVDQDLTRNQKLAVYYYYDEDDTTDPFAK